MRARPCFKSALLSAGLWCVGRELPLMRWLLLIGCSLWEGEASEPSNAASSYATAFWSRHRRELRNRPALVAQVPRPERSRFGVRLGGSEIAQGRAPCFDLRV